MNSLGWPKVRFEWGDKIISEIEDKTIKFIKSEEHKGKVDWIKVNIPSRSKGHHEATLRNILESYNKKWD
jgi:hypothetical protein